MINNGIQPVTDRVECLEEEQKMCKKRVTDLEKRLENEVKLAKAKRLLNDLHSRRLNYLAIGVKETPGRWSETNLDCHNTIKDLFVKMNIPDPDQIKIIDCHRLGKKPEISENLIIDGKSTEKCRPIIFKVADNFMVKTIKDNLPNLKQYFKNNVGENEVYFKRHIPKEMYDQRNRLQPKYSELLKAGRKPEWQLNYTTAEYYIKDNTGKFHNDVTD